MRLVVLLGSLGLLTSIGCSSSVCDSWNGACVDLSVQGTGRVDELRVTLSGATAGMRTARREEASLPLRLALELEGSVSGALTIEVQAFLTGAWKGAGRTSSTLVKGGRASATVTLSQESLATDLGDDVKGADLSWPCTDTGNDPRNCGSCGHDCLGGACLAGVCQPVVMAAGLSQPHGVAVSSEAVFVTAGSPSHILAVPHSGGTPAELSSTAVNAHFLAVSGTMIYFTATDGTVNRLDRSSGIVTEIANNQNGPSGIAVDGAEVFWGNSGFGGDILRWDGVAAPTVFVAGLGSIHGLALSAQKLFFVRGGGILSVARTSPGTPEGVLSPSQVPWGLALADDTLYFTTRSDGKVYRVSVADQDLGAGLPEILAAGQQDPSGIAVDGMFVYWANTAGGTLVRLRR